ncbi:putative squalene monooxygenase [Venturia nashicola]|uniref:Putative squalene monooxygenase n=1 Tax=Venturia nashicola TaxID=86259 RepID=A0A4Z1P2M5_9PEZI|nr:putative squalene monooxygenase [Venturia nashicola]TLD20868.1 putative squalene monooxygenase [Venturia nashicola]
MSEPTNLADKYRTQDTNYTSKPVDYLDREVEVQVEGAPGIHMAHPSIGSQPILDANGSIAPRSIAPDMMEAIFLGDPGHFLNLENGACYYLWRKAKLMMQGKSLVTGRLYPNFPPFHFDFTSVFSLPHPETGGHFKSDINVQHGTYAYFYYCWKVQEFPDGVDAHGDSGSKDCRIPAKVDQNQNANKTPSLDEFLRKAGFWGQFGPEYCIASTEGDRIRGVVLMNMLGHMEIAWHELIHKTSRYVNFPNKRADVIPYLEFSMKFWTDATWKRPDGIPVTPKWFKHFRKDTEMLPYFINADKYVQQREVEIRRAIANREEFVSPAQVQLDFEKERVGLRAETKEEAEFMDQFLDYTDCEETAEEREDIEDSLIIRWATMPLGSGV